MGMVHRRLVIAAVGALLVMIAPPIGASAAEAEPELVTTTVSLKTDCLSRELVFTVSAPRSARQGEVFTVEDFIVTFPIPALLGGQQVSVELERPHNAAGMTFDTTGYIQGYYPNYTPVLDTEPASAGFAVWGEVGDSMDFFVGEIVIRGDYLGFPVFPIRCRGAGSTPVVSVLIDPPAGGGPITDEVSVQVIDADGAIVYENQGFVADGNFAVIRGGDPRRDLLVGRASLPSENGGATMTLYSDGGAGSEPASVLELSDPGAGISIEAISALPHISSGNHETLAGFAAGLMNGVEPVGVYWVVRDLA